MQMRNAESLIFLPKLYFLFEIFSFNVVAPVQSFAVVAWFVYV